MVDVDLAVTTVLSHSQVRTRTLARWAPSGSAAAVLRRLALNSVGVARSNRQRAADHAGGVMQSSRRSCPPAQAGG